MHPVRRKIIAVLFFLAVVLPCRREVQAVVLMNPTLDLSGSWTYTDRTGKGTKNDPYVYPRTLVFNNLTVTTALIFAPPNTEYYNVNTPGVEEIIGATVTISGLVRDASNNWLFSNGTFTITETGNTYLSAALTNVTFTPDPVNTSISWLNVNLDTNNLTNINTSTNTRASRYIWLLTGAMNNKGQNWTNIRLEMDMLSGTRDFTQNSGGTTLGKINGIPEPTSLALLCLGLAAVISRWRRKI